MKIFYSLVFIFSFSIIFAQKNATTIYSNTPKVKIIESKEIITDWTLNPKLKPDVYTTGKVSKYKEVKLVTDIDSIEVKLKPNQKFDFIILLNKKDSCFTRFESPKNVDFSKTNPTFRQTIPFHLTEFNNISVNAILNKKDSIKLMFDTGSVDFSLTKEAIKKYLNPKGLKLTMKDISDNNFKISNLNWQHQQIYPIETTAQGNDGMFGWNAFDGKILEINYDKNIMIVHSKLPKIGKEFEKFPMELMKEHFCIYLDLENNGKKHKTRYLFDSGYQRAIMLDNDILKESNLKVEDFKLVKETKMYNSQNEEIPLKTVLLPKLHFGKYVLENIPAQINSYNKSAGYNTNFLGNEILKRFNAILDFQNNVVYLKPNKYFNEEYAEMKKN